MDGIPLSISPDRHDARLLGLALVLARAQIAADVPRRNEFAANDRLFIHSLSELHQSLNCEAPIRLDATLREWP
jgi:hypothetical protein